VNDRAAAVHLLHGLRGVAGNLRATQVAEHAAAAEAALRRGDEGAVELHLPLLAQAVEQALAGAGQLAAQSPARAQQARGERRDGAATAVLRGLKPLLEQGSLEADGFLQDNRAALAGFPELASLERQVAGSQLQEALATVGDLARSHGLQL
jgi:hypothetical protein